MTDETAVRLLRQLRQEPDGPAMIDVPRTMTEGRRRRVLRRWSGGFALVTLTAVTAGGGTLAVSALRPSPPAPPTVTAAVTTATATATATAVPAAPAGPTGCAVTRLPTAGVRKALVTAGDPSGRYLVGRLYDTSANTIVWKDGKILARPRVPGGDATFSDVDSSGTAVGSAFTTLERQQAYVYRDGTVTELAGRHTAALAINDAGVIVGSVGEVLSEVPARWASAGAPVTKLPLAAGMTGRADGIAEDGTVVGTAGPKGREESGYLWRPDGTGRAMPLPTVDGKKADFFWPESITNGWVAGRAVFDEDAGRSRRFTSLRYDIAAGTYQKLSTTVIPALLAANGWVAGVTDRPVIVAGAEVVRLPGYRTATAYDVTGVSADGRRVAGYSSLPDNEPLLWTCD